MRHTAHLVCAFPDGALRIADQLGDMARNYGLIAWTNARATGEWEIRIEGDEDRLRHFASEVGFSNLGAATGE